MSIKIINREYREKFTGGVTDFMLGNVGDWQKATLEVEVGIDFVANLENTVEIDYLNNAFVIQSGKNWGDFGFAVGQIVTLRYKKSIDTDNDQNYETVSTVSNPYTVLNISGSTMEVDEDISVDNFDTIPTNYGAIKITEVIFTANQKPEGCRLTYGHIGNDQAQAGQLQSLIDGTTTGFDLADLNAIPPGTFGNMTPIGMQSGMSVRNVKVKESADAFGYFASWNVPESQLYDLRMQRDSPFNDDIDYTSAVPLGINLLSAVTGYQTALGTNLVGQEQEGLGNITYVSQNQCFILNAPGTYTQQFSLNFNWKLVALYQSNNPAFITLELIKTAYGANPMAMVQTTLIKSWGSAVANGEELGANVGRTYNYNDIFSVDVESGFCYALVLRYKHFPGGFNDYGANIQVFSGSMNASEPNEAIADSYKRKYTFELDFMISNLFENVSTFEENTIPEYLAGDDSLTDNFKLEFFPYWNNPNVLISNNLLSSIRDGNIGWYNENYNQLANHFTVEECRYFDSNGNEVESIDYTAQTRVSGIIAGVPNISALTTCGFGFAWCPKDEADFKNRQTPFYRNVFAQTGSDTAAYNVGTFYPAINIGAGLGGSIDSRNIVFTNLGGGRLAFQVVLEPNAGFTTFFDARTDEDRNFVFWVSMADSTLARNQSDRVNLLCDFNSMIKNIPLAGAYPMKADFLEHPQSDTEIGEGLYDGFIVDDVLARLLFGVDYLTSKIEKMNFGVEAYNPTTGQRKVLERLQYDLTGFPNDANGVHQINLDTTRGFKLESGNNKNWVKVMREPTTDATGVAGYIAYFAFKLRYEDWLPLADVPSDFFDLTAANNGFNNDWFHYFATAGWRVAFFSEIDITEIGVLKEYRNKFDLTIKTNDTNTLVTCEHKYFRDSTNALLNIGDDPITGRPLGVILNNEKTRVEISYEIIDDVGVWDAAHIYAVTTLEIDKGAGFMQLRQLSSVWGSETDNPLVPVAGQTKLKVVISGDNKKVTTSCLIDPELLDIASRYRITGRIGCYAAGRPVEFGLYEGRYEDKYE